MNKMLQMKGLKRPFKDKRMLMAIGLVPGSLDYLNIKK